MGSWEGTGKVSSEFGFEVKPDPEHGIPGGKSSGWMTSVCTVKAEFKPDGTYVWNERHVGEGDSKGTNISLTVPEKNGPPAHWTIVRAKGAS